MWALFHSILIPFLFSNQIKPKYVVEHVIALSTALLQVENLCKHHGRTVVNGELASYEADNTVIDGGLAVQRINFMSDLAKACQLVIYSLLAHELLTLESKHWFRSKHLHKALQRQPKSYGLVIWGRKAAWGKEKMCFEGMSDKIPILDKKKVKVWGIFIFKYEIYGSWTL